MDDLQGSSASPAPRSDSSSAGAPAAPAIAPAPSLAQRIFFGPLGLRAGWSLLIYFSIIAALIFAIRGVQLHQKAKRDHAAAVSRSTSKPSPSGQPAPSTKAAAPKAAPAKPGPLAPAILGESVFFAIFFLLSWLMAAIERRKLSAFGLGGARPLGRFLTGAFWGLAAMSLLIAALFSMHLLVFDARLDHGWSILGWGAAELGLFALVGLTEEYVFRGYLQFTLTRGLVGLGKAISPANAKSIAFWIAATITSAIFFFAHTANGGETKLGLTTVFLAGLLLLIALWRTGSLWWAIGFHTTWDWAQSFLYGVPDSGGLVQGRLFATHALGKPLLSGGTAGPEGSVLCLPVLLLVILVLCFTPTSPLPSLELKPRKLATAPPADHPSSLETMEPLS